MEVEREWWTNSLVMDIHNTLRRKEMELLSIPYLAQSPQLHMRRYLVDWIAVIAENFSLCAPTRHLAIYLLDYTMDRFDIEEKVIYLVAIVCLLVAAKFEEIDNNLPHVRDVYNYVKHCDYSAEGFLEMELKLLHQFQWNISMPTSAHFIEYYLTAAVQETDWHGDRLVDDIPKAEVYMSKYASYFLEICLQDHSYREWSPSLVAAACIAASRACLHLTPFWNAALHKLTAYNWSDVQPVTELMLRTHSVDEQHNQAKQLEVAPSILGSTVMTPSPSPVSEARATCQANRENLKTCAVVNCSDMTATANLYNYTEENRLS